MIYHYFGSKEGLYLAALERVYEGLRGEERTLHLDHLAPEMAIRRLIEFNFDYSHAHPEMISLINSENLHRARHLRKSKKVRELHSPFVKLIADILRRGVAAGVFRRGLDPIDVYITIAAIGYFLPVEQLDAVGNLRPRSRDGRRAPAAQASQCRYGSSRPATVALTKAAFSAKCNRVVT